MPKLLSLAIPYPADLPTRAMALHKVPDKDSQIETGFSQIGRRLSSAL
ncbi:hypothetical protein [Terrimonas ferruginea]|nr:hypothetical protein [Terrimonas ferruginea]